MLRGALYAPGAGGGLLHCGTAARLRSPVAGPLPSPSRSLHANEGLRGPGVLPKVPVLRGAPAASSTRPGPVAKPPPAPASPLRPRCFGTTVDQRDCCFSYWGLTQHNLGPDPALSMPGCCPGCHQPLQPCPDALYRHHSPGVEEGCLHPGGCRTLRPRFPQPPDFGEESSKGNTSQKDGPVNLVALQQGSIAGDSSGALPPLCPWGAKATQSTGSRSALCTRQWEARCQPDVSTRS